VAQLTFIGHSHTSTAAQIPQPGLSWGMSVVQGQERNGKTIQNLNTRLVITTSPVGCQKSKLNCATQFQLHSEVVKGYNEIFLFRSPSGADSPTFANFENPLSHPPLHSTPSRCTEKKSFCWNDTRVCIGEVESGGRRVGGVFREWKTGAF
jgi:hypothetical protein